MDQMEDPKLEDPLWGNPIAIGDDCASKGEEHFQGDSLFRMDLAAHEFEKAAVAYKLAKSCNHNFLIDCSSLPFAI